MPRRTSRLARCCLGLLLLGAALVATYPSGAKTLPAPTKLWVYIGTYTGGKARSEGIYKFDLDLETGKLTGKELAAKAINPSFLAIHPNHRFLYAVSEVDTLEKKKTGGVAAFSIDRKTGKLTRLNVKPSGGQHPCHLVVDKAGKHVLVANYTGGNASALLIDEEGKLGKTTGFKQHKGSSVNKDRQEAPHAHSINLDPANKFAFVADLGLDKVLVYKFDKGELIDNDPPAYKTAGGAGPRHFAFHPSGKYAYVINELDSTIDALSYDAKKGVLKKVQTISTLPKGYKGSTTTAEVVVHPTGKFVYGSNRGHDSIACFKVDQKTGKLTFVAHQKKGIKTPRNFAIDPTGKFCLVANQEGDSVIVFRVDSKTGELKETGHSAKVGMPVCVRFMPVPS
jgi:6-phosphogluconolactonase